MKNNFLNFCLIGIIVVCLFLIGCDDKDCGEINACHGIVRNGVFIGSSCGDSKCAVTTIQNNAATIKDLDSVVYCNCNGND